MSFGTRHRLRLGDARGLEGVDDASVHLVVTSPPYPMIAMWDEVFRRLSPAVGEHLDGERGMDAFAAMHAELDRVWAGLWRVLVPGGFACVNVGDATRTVGGEFRLYPNHARVVSAMTALGFATLPDILWRKPTNAPNKFMGSGMLPAGAYVTYEHEYVLVFRKGGLRDFASPEARANRSRSAFFWEERNVWFSDVWQGLPGTRQALAASEARARSGAFPFELAYRLICMYSAYEDRVLDPFGGTGTTLLAAAAAGRNGCAFELDPSLVPAVGATLGQAVEVGNARVDERLAAHRAFVEEREAAGRPPKNTNGPHGFAVVTRQERDLVLLRPQRVREVGALEWAVEHGVDAPASGQLDLFGG